MTAPLANFLVLAARLGVDSSSSDGEELRSILDSVSAALRHRTRRGFEAAITTYTEDYRMEDAAQRSLTLRHNPLIDVLSVMLVQWDGTTLAYDPQVWRIEDAYTSRLYLWPYGWGWSSRARLYDDMYRPVGPYWLRISYRVTGDIPADLVRAAEDWSVAKWQDKDRRGLAGYTTGSDSEHYTTNVGEAPPEVSKVIAEYFQSRSGGPV